MSDLSMPVALTVPELLLQYFRHLDMCDQATAARVCKLWWEVALDVLWGENPIKVWTILKMISRAIQRE